MQDQITVQDGIKSGLLDGINPKEQDTNVQKTLKFIE
jgi:hypothetical protein